MSLEPNALESQLSITDRNTDIPFTPSQSWILTEEDKDTFIGPTFGWIQAFFHDTLTENPQLAVFSGKKNLDGTRQANIVRFAFSGERVKFKGCGILTSGKDCRGVTITSAPIGNSPTTDLLQVIVEGGAY
jgi:hypothetical protein